MSHVPLASQNQSMRSILYVGCCSAELAAIGAAFRSKGIVNPLLRCANPDRASELLASRGTSRVVVPLLKPGLVLLDPPSRQSEALNWSRRLTGLTAEAGLPLYILLDEGQTLYSWCLRHELPVIAKPFTIYRYLLARQDDDDMWLEMKIRPS